MVQQFQDNKQASNSSETGYYNLVSEGVACLSSIRRYKPKKGSEQLHIRFRAFHGQANEELTYVYFDTHVVDKEGKAQLLFNWLMSNGVLNEKGVLHKNCKISFTFKMGDMRLEVFKSTFKNTSSQLTDQERLQEDLGISTVIRGRFFEVMSVRLDGHNYKIDDILDRIESKETLQDVINNPNPHIPTPFDDAGDVGCEFDNASDKNVDQAA